MHGGVVATLLDHVLARAVRAAGRGGLTATLTVTYRRPVPLGVPLRRHRGDGAHRRTADDGRAPGWSPRTTRGRRSPRPRGCSWRCDPTARPTSSRRPAATITRLDRAQRRRMSEPSADARRARSFGALAEEYELRRPGYPDDAVDWLLPPGARAVADVGAGTGKLTAALLARGLDVVAVEPDPAMLGVLAARLPAADARLAGADALPLPDGSVDAVVVGQAWHWFPQDRAAAEVRRVLRPGGWLGLVWNQVWPQEPWQTEVERLNASARGHELDIQDELPDVIEVPGLPSAELEAALFPWSESLDAAALCARLATYSHISLLDPADRDSLLEAVTAVVTDEAARRGTPALPYHQVAYCVRWSPAA